MFELPQPNPDSCRGLSLLWHAKYSGKVKPMNALHATWRHPAVLCLVGGWVIGMVWWAPLVFALEDEQFIERPIPVGSRLMETPLVAWPWAAMGMVVGIVGSLLRGYWVPVGAILGTVGGGLFCLATSKMDGWLVLTMPLCCFAGTFVGLIVGVVCGVSWAVWANPSDSA